MRLQLHAIAAGVGLTYELLTGDLSQVNYSSIRAGLIEFRRRMEALQWQLLRPRPLPAGVAALRAGGAGGRQAARRRHRPPTGPHRASRRSIR